MKTSFLDCKHRLVWLMSLGSWWDCHYNLIITPRCGFPPQCRWHREGGNTRAVFPRSRVFARYMKQTSDPGFWVGVRHGSVVVGPQASGVAQTCIQTPIGERNGCGLTKLQPHVHREHQRHGQFISDHGREVVERQASRAGQPAP